MSIVQLMTWARFLTRLSQPEELQLTLAACLHRRAFIPPTEVWAVIEPTGGFLSAREAGFLFHAANTWPVAGPVIELGSYEGRSTLVFALAGRDVHAVDAWSLDIVEASDYQQIESSMETVRERFFANLRRAGVEARVTAHQGLTRQVAQHWTVPCAILFIDAGHSYEDVSNDLRLWTRFLLPDGLLIMHDVILHDHRDVTRAASELLPRGWRVIACAGSIVAFSQPTSR